MAELIITRSCQQMIIIENECSPKNWSNLVKWLNDEKDGNEFILDGIPYPLKKETIIQVIVNIPVSTRVLQLAWKSLACLKQ